MLKLKYFIHTYNIYYDSVHRIIIVIHNEYYYIIVVYNYILLYNIM